MQRTMRSAGRWAAGIIICGILLALTQPGEAQGKRADYERASTIAQSFVGKIYRGIVTPNWIDGKNSFWYRNDLPGGKREFVRVDPETAMKKPAFDHARLAALLTKTLKKPVSAERLPVDSITYGTDESILTAQVGANSYIWNLTADTLNLSDKPLGQTNALPPAMVRASLTADEESALTFRNRRDEPVTLNWLDGEGVRREYGVLLPGGARLMNTYKGHAWLITGKDGTPIVGFIAAAAPMEAVIDQTMPASLRAPRGGPTRRPDGRPNGRPRIFASQDSPDGKWHILIRNNNVVLQAMPAGVETPLTMDGTPKDSYETSSFWSPDSSKVVIMKTVPAQEHKITLVESSPKDQVQPKLHSIDYLKAGDQIEMPRPHLFDIATKRDISIKNELFSNPWEITALHWEPDSKRFTFRYMQRGFGACKLIGVQAESGEAKALIDEQASTFIDWTNKVFLRQIDATHEAVWMSERSGWNHLYHYDTSTGQVKNPITKGEWVVRGVERVDEAKRQIWFRAGGIIPGQDPYYIQYARVNFDGTGLTLLTDSDGTHTITYTPDGKYLLDSYSRVDMPMVTELRRVEDGKKILSLEKGDASALLATGWHYPERFVSKARDGKTDIYGVIVRPSNFDHARSYPVLENIYAGPQGSFVPKTFAPANLLQQMAELGFIVVQIDGMGTNNRSKAFHDVCWKNLGDAGFPDRILWIKAAAAKYSYMDLTRVGIYGTSAGGQNALGGLLLHGDFYKAGMADSGCHDNRMDKIWWNEQWMGWPVGPQYEASSNVKLAPKLQGKLLLMVGEMDTNVDPASTMQVVDQLIKANKDFELLSMPGAGHGVAGTPYGKRRLQDFFVRTLLGVEPRKE